MEANVVQRILLITLMAVIYCSCSFALPARAAQPVMLYFDNKQVLTEPVQIDSTGQDIILGSYYLDILPQIEGERVYVPIRIVAKYLGADIAWQNPQIVINYSDTELTLTIGSKLAYKDGADFVIDAQPYIKDGRTMVPLRFIAEAFACQVSYNDHKVYVNTPPLQIAGKTVKSVQHRVHMTNGADDYEAKENILISRLYSLLAGKCRQEIPSPVIVGEDGSSGMPANYYKLSRYSFMETEGISGEALQQYQLYQRRNWLDLAGEYTGDTLIYDVTGGRWYECTDDDFLDIADILTIGAWQWRISE